MLSARLIFGFLINGSSRITRKILLAVALCVLLILPASVYLMESSNFRQQKQVQIEKQNLITEGQAVMLLEPMANQDEESIFLTMTGILANPDIIGVSIEFANDEPALEIGKTDGKLTASFDIQHIASGKRQLLGTITTYGSTRQLDDAFAQRLKQIVLFVCVLIAVIMALLAVTLRRLVGVPLQRIVDSIEKSEVGEITEIDWASNDEVGVVVERLNFLHTKLHDQLLGLKEALSIKERQEAARLQELANATSEAILIYKGEQILDLNEPMAEMLGQSRDSLLTQPVSEILPESVCQELWMELQDGVTHDLDAQLTAGDGEMRMVELMIQNFRYQAESAKVAVMRDITDRLKAEEKIRQMALYDGLTGMPNRAYFMTRLDEAISSIKEKKIQLALMYVDLDKFKDINDTLGHPMGDKVLQDVSRVMLEQASPGDVCRRLGGDEFAIFVVRAVGQPFSPEDIAQNLTETIGALAGRNGIPAYFGCSIGLAIYQNAATSKSEFLTQADLALYDAKSHGRNCYRVYNKALDSGYRRQRRIQEKLPLALNGGRLSLSYQPQAETATREIVGFEALLRWHDDELGQISPNEILFAAQQKHCIRELGKWVVQTACKEASTWPVDVRVAVNLTTAEVVDGSLADCIMESLQLTGLAAHRLEIEIGEEALVADLGKSRRTIERLKEAGVGVVLDEFGAGFSSLKLLRSIRFDRIKIVQRADEEQDILASSENDTVSSVSSLIIELGKKLGAEVIATGVESEETFLALKALNCDYVQGYFIGRPIEDNRVGDYVEKYCADFRKAS